VAGWVSTVVREAANLHFHDKVTDRRHRGHCQSLHIGNFSETTANHFTTYHQNNESKGSFRVYKKKFWEEHGYQLDFECFYLFSLFAQFAYLLVLDRFHNFALFFVTERGHAL
jgi:hypothetical protein